VITSEHDKSIGADFSKIADTAALGFTTITSSSYGHIGPISTDGCVICYRNIVEGQHTSTAIVDTTTVDKVAISVSPCAHSARD
jgi:hypothetical protein